MLYKNNIHVQTMFTLGPLEKIRTRGTTKNEDAQFTGLLDIKYINKINKNISSIKLK